jgi:hypothetical protein
MVQKSTMVQYPIDNHYPMNENLIPRRFQEDPFNFPFELMMLVWLMILLNLDSQLQVTNEFEFPLNQYRLT